MFECLETGHQIVLSLRAGCEFRHHWIVSHRDWKARVAQRRTKCVITATKIDHTSFRFYRCPVTRHELGIAAGARSPIVGIDQYVFVIIYVLSEIIMGPIVKCIGKEKFTVCTATVINRHASQREMNAARLLARFVKIDDTVEKRRSPADLARADRCRNTLEAIDHIISERWICALAPSRRRSVNYFKKRDVRVPGESDRAADVDFVVVMHGIADALRSSG